MAKRLNYNKGDAKLFMADALRQYNIERQPSFKGKRKTINKLAQLHKVTYKALSDRINEKIVVDAQAGNKRILSQEEELELVECLKLLAAGGFGFTNSDVIKFVNDYLKSKNIDANGPSIPWVTLFLRKYKGQISRRRSKTIHHTCVKSAKKIIIDDFFGLLSDTFKNSDINELKYVLWNADEAGFAPVLTHKNVIAARGSRNVQSITFNNSHDYTTVHVCANANGDLMKPFILFKQTIPDKTKLWQGAVYKSSLNGWMMTHNFLYWLEYVFYPSEFEVAQCYNPDYTGPYYLIVDGHFSHTNFEVVQMSRRLNITLIKLPAHSTHYLQPLDVGFFAPVKKLWYSAVESYSKINTRNITKIDFSLIFEQLWSNLSPEYVRNGFRKTGLFPLDVNAINASDLNMAVPWTDDGFLERFGYELNKISDVEQPFVSHCLKSMQKILTPPITTQIRRVITPEQRMKRGSGLGENLNSRPVFAAITNYEPQLIKSCEVCQLIGPKNFIWVECFTCDRKIHKKCYSELRNMNEKQIRKIIWVCPFCKQLVNKNL